MSNIIDNLIESIKVKENPTVLGLDPRYDMIPNYIKSKYSNDLSGACEAILEFNKGLIDATSDIIPAVKPQIAFYELFGVEGMNVFLKTCEYAKAKSMFVIADIKRGDIGSTAEAYSNAYIGKNNIDNIRHSVFDVDFVTLNPYLGLDSIEPFIKAASEYNKGMFILVKTSNNSSKDIQDLELKDGRKLYMQVAELINKWGKDLIGENGYSLVSAVVGATYPKELNILRDIMPNSYFLIPGYGAQGAKAENIIGGFDNNGIGGIINASRSLMYAYKLDRWKTKYSEEDYKEATRAEALRMKSELNSAIANKIIVD